MPKVTAAPGPHAKCGTEHACVRPALCTAHAVKILTSQLLLLPTHLLRLLGRLEGRIHFLLVAGCKGRSALPTASSEGE